MSPEISQQINEALENLNKKIDKNNINQQEHIGRLQEALEKAENYIRELEKGILILRQNQRTNVTFD
jgi:ElaB/YqjD/DUF883 family membrane-anchored ribosome-binding protein